MLTITIQECYSLDDIFLSKLCKYVAKAADELAALLQVIN